MLKIDKTALADIIAEEDDTAFKALRMSSIIEKPSDDTEVSADGEEKKDDDAAGDSAKPAVCCNETHLLVCC